MYCCEPHRFPRTILAHYQRQWLVELDGYLVVRTETPDALDEQLRACRIFKLCFLGFLSQKLHEYQFTAPWLTLSIVLMAARPLSCQG